MTSRFLSELWYISFQTFMNSCIARNGGDFCTLARLMTRWNFSSDDTGGFEEDWEQLMNPNTDADVGSCLDGEMGMRWSLTLLVGIKSQPTGRWVSSKYKKTFAIYIPHNIRGKIIAHWNLLNQRLLVRVGVIANLWFKICNDGGLWLDIFGLRFSW
jgi:hypothetical protein